MRRHLIIKIKDKKITFRTEIEITSSIIEFQKVTAALVDLPIKLRLEWPIEHFIRYLHEKRPVYR